MKYVYPRLSFDGELKNHPKVKMIPAPLIEISATFIRKAIKEKKVSLMLWNYFEPKDNWVSTIK
jgi:hypothetical protein